MKIDKQEAELKLVGSPPPIGHPASTTGGPREITIVGLWQTFRRGLWLVVLVALLAVAAAAAMLKARVPVYEAAMTVVPAARDLALAGQIAAELEQYAGLANLAQSPVEIEAVSTLDRYLTLLTSTRVAARLTRDPAIMAALFGAQWDPATNAWQPPQGMVASVKQAVLGFFGFPEFQEPGPALIAARLAERLSVRGSTGLYRLTISDPDPASAVGLLATMHEAADEILREEALARVGAQIEELEARLEGEVGPARRAALEALLAERYRTEALIAADESYAAELIDPPSASGWPTSAHPLLVLVLALVVGVIVGIFIVFLRDALRSLRP